MSAWRELGSSFCCFSRYVLKVLPPVLPSQGLEVSIILRMGVCIPTGPAVYRHRVDLGLRWEPRESVPLSARAQVVQLFVALFDGCEALRGFYPTRFLRHSDQGSGPWLQLPNPD